MTTTPGNMDRDAWQQVDRLYHAALERPAAERAAFLDKACPDPKLRREVESLLNFEPADDTVFDSPAWEKRLAPGERLGPYEIVGRTGGGGMGEVWKARDTRLGREVAIKVCTERFSDRFRREARAIAVLNHPHICTLYDVGADCLVMEYIEGAPIQGPLPLERVSKLGAQIADALDAAHRRGIVHRDLKPANILVTKSGVKVLDFGLAKMENAVAAGAQPETVTQHGAIVGTLPYMSPEQIQGNEIDARSDIFSFGLVLYEMLTGRRAFEADNSASLIAAILEREPPNLEKIEPVGLQRVLRRCVAKNPEERWQSAADLKAALEFMTEAASQPRPGRRFVAGWLAAALFAAALAPIAFLYFREKPPAPAAPIRFQIPAPENAALALSVSPDGRKLALLAGDRLWAHFLDAGEWRDLADAIGVVPFWSPDSRFIGYTSQGKLKKIEATGGPQQTVADLPVSLQGTLTGAWNQDDVIVFANRSGLFRVPASGGVPVAITAPDPARHETHHFAPSFLPDGRHFVYTRRSIDARRSAIFLGSVDAKPEQQSSTPLITSSWQAAYAPSADPSTGYLFFMREGTLVVQPFDNRRMELNGRAEPLAERVGDVNDSAGVWAAFSASGGVLAYRVEGPWRLRWFDRKGGQLGDVGPVGEYWDPALSPDGHTVAVSMRTSSGWDIWAFDLLRGTKLRLTYGGNRYNPNWSLDSRQIAFRVIGSSPDVAHRVLANGAGKEELAARLDRSAVAWQWTRDGRFLILTLWGAGKPTEIWAAPVDGSGKPFPLVAGEFSNSEGRVSPDGKWIAYMGMATGRNEVYIQDFASKGGKRQISTAGGVRPLWRTDGRELFYREGSKVMSVEVRTNAGRLEVGIPKLLFDAPGSRLDPVFDVSADGQKFLLVVSSEEKGAPQPINVVINWPAGIKRP
jgi:Tol biopolymer transport system component/predicted Ser/Thr protein kinase